jgi:glycosyltransferase involved in cell wall biosynthesis
MDFLVYKDECDYDVEIKSLGCRIFKGPHMRNPLPFAANLRQVLRADAPYDVVHSHFHQFNGWVLRAAAASKVPCRIAHSHNDTRERDRLSSPPKRAYFSMMNRLIYRHATTGLACSIRAAESQFGGRWDRDGRFRVLGYGLDLRSFAVGREQSGLRRELGLPEDAQVIGHVGRFVEQKNHRQLLDISAEVMRRRPNAWLLLVGEGPLVPEVKRRAKELGITQRVVFAGVRPDVPRLMLEAMDLFLFPSLHEGLGLVLVEAQAAGLPCIYSDVVPREADVAIPLLSRLPLSASSEVWADSVCRALDGPPSLSASVAYQRLAESTFSIQHSVSALRRVYSGEVNTSARVAGVAR